MRLKLILPMLLIIACFDHNNQAQAQTSSQQDQYLIAILDTIYRTEQAPIRLRDSLMNVYGVASKEAQVQQEIYVKNHAINEKKIKEILDKYGWLGEEVIGGQAGLIISNVLQHSDSATRIAYLPMMQEAVKKGNLHPRFLGRAEDRIATDRRELQVYGGQMKYYPETKSFNVWPVLDPTNVDKRRAEIGLGPIAEHLNNRFNFVWDLEEQIQRTAAFEKDKNKEEE